MEDREEIIIYKATDGTRQLEVHLKDETIWLSQYQIATVFKTNRTSVQKHINNIYKTRELPEKSTCAKFAQVQKEGRRTVTRKVLNYNLDVVISVGYRVNSKQGTQFRMWATKKIKEHVVKGYTINQKRLSEQQEKLKELQGAVGLIKNSVSDKQISSEEEEGLSEIVSQYARSLIFYY